jgi:threonine dehydrogenase-like Zn-dependent dehydrogenase
MDMTRGHGVDIVYDTSANQNAGPQGIKMLKTKGKLVVIGHYSGTMDLLDPSYKGYSIIGNVSYNWDTWERLIPYLERRRLDFGMLISHKLSLDEVEKGFELARSKKSVKTLFIPGT